MLEPLSQKLHNIEDLTIRDCFDAVPLRMIHMPPLVKQLVIANCENVKFVLVSEAPLVHLQRISISHCNFLTSLFDDDMEHLVPNLEELCIKRCPKMEPFSLGSLPSSLKQLEIRDCDELLTCHIEWSHLPSITKLLISTPFDTLYCNGLQHLTSLQELEILYSPKLEKIEGGMMPPFLQRLHISDCWPLEEQCRNKDEEIWPKISHVPCISLDDTYLIRSLEHIQEDQDMNDAIILEDQDLNDEINLEDQDPYTLEDQEMNDATIQVQSPSPAKLRAMVKFFKGCFKIN